MLKFDNAHPDKEHNWLCGYYWNWDTGYSVGNDMVVRANEPQSVEYQTGGLK